MGEIGGKMYRFTSIHGLQALFMCAFFGKAISETGGSNPTRNHDMHVQTPQADQAPEPRPLEYLLSRPVMTCCYMAHWAVRFKDSDRTSVVRMSSVRTRPSKR